jgi:hypothetical protein
MVLTTGLSWSLCEGSVNAIAQIYEKPVNLQSLVAFLTRITYFIYVRIILLGRCFTVWAG